MLFCGSRISSKVIITALFTRASPKNVYAPFAILKAKRNAQKAQNEKAPKMEEFFTQNSIYVVLVIVLVIFTGLFIYLLRLEKKLTALEQQFSEQDEAQQKR